MRCVQVQYWSGEKSWLDDIMFEDGAEFQSGLHNLLITELRRKFSPHIKTVEIIKFYN